jgi:uncharacterized protein YndB with AHSA1/START domain
MTSMTQDIVVEEVLPHAPGAIWKTLTTGELIGRWLKLTPEGFEPVNGTRFMLRTRPAGAWDGVIHCEVLEVTRNERLSYSWVSGDEGNVGYGSRLDTVVTFTLAKVDGGTRLRLVHSGFVTPKNDTSLRNFREGWNRLLGRIGVISGEP